MVITLPSYAVGGHPFSVVVEKQKGVIAYHEERAERAEAALKVARQERDHCYASFDNARRRLHEIEAFVTGGANDYRINEKLKDNEKSIKSLIEHLMAMADNYHTVNQLYIQAKERAEKAEAILIQHYCDYEFKPTLEQAVELMLEERREKKATEAENAALRKDAERYRWLRLASVDANISNKFVTVCESEPTTPDLFDAAIDSARTE